MPIPQLRRTGGGEASGQAHSGVLITLSVEPSFVLQNNISFPRESSQEHQQLRVLLPLSELHEKVKSPECVWQ